MTKTFALIATMIALTATPVLAAGGPPYTLDAKGKCHASDGKFAKKELCVSHSYKLDAKGKCHDEKGKFAKAEFCKS